MRVRIERWLPVVGFEGLYEVSNKGRVKSLPCEVKYIDGRNRHYKHSRILRFKLIGKVDPHGKAEWRHHGVCLTSKGRGGFGVKTYRLVAHLVLEAFVGPCPVGNQGCHNDGNSLNDCLSNLRWDTPKNNAADKFKHGTGYNVGKGKTHGHAKLDPERVIEIRKRYLTGNETHRSLAIKYSVHKSTITNILSGVTWVGV